MIYNSYIFQHCRVREVIMELYEVLLYNVQCKMDSKVIDINIAKEKAYTIYNIEFINIFL